jgi:hypothetical protein
MAAHAASAVITVSDHSKQDIVRLLRVDGSKVTVAPCGMGDYVFKVLLGSNADVYGSRFRRSPGSSGKVRRSLRRSMFDRDLLVISEQIEGLVALQDEAVKRWHASETSEHNSPFLVLVLEQHGANYELWHLEDFARRRDMPDADIVSTKWRIDQVNQRRNDLIEAVDVFLLEALHHASANPPSDRLHSETVGMIIDRLSILALKSYHTQQEIERCDASPEHRDRNRVRLATLLEQRGDLHRCLVTFWRELAEGRVAMKLYRQFKMYNDATLNPELYRNARA